VIDNFLPEPHAEFLSQQFPDPEHPVWLDWRTRHPGQYGKQGPGDDKNFDLLTPDFRRALQQFNSPAVLEYLESLTGIADLLPDPHFTGGGMHQIVAGKHWEPGYGGELEFWNDAPASGGVCTKRIEPLFNRFVVFQTDKRSFHGHPNEWSAPAPLTRRSLAFYYYTKDPAEGVAYDEITDFQGVAEKPLPPK